MVLLGFVATVGKGTEASWISPEEEFVASSSYGAKSDLGTRSRGERDLHECATLAPTIKHVRE